MSYLLLSIFTIQSLYITYWSTRNYFRAISVISFFNISYIGMILIGFFAIVLYNPYPFSEKTISFALLYAILLQMAAFLGFISKINFTPKKILLFLFPNNGTSYKNILRLGFFYTIIGIYFFYKYYSLPSEYLLSEHSGLTVFYLFFAKAVYIGYLLILTVSLRKNNVLLKRISFLIFCIIFGILLFRLKRTETLIFISSTIFRFLLR